MRVLSAAAVVLLLFGLGGCARSPRSALLTNPPQHLPPEWVRTGLDAPPLDQVPEALRQLGPLEWVRVSYRTQSGTAMADAYRMKSAASAFEARQKWHNEPGSVVFDHGQMFVVCSSVTEPTEVLIDFSRELEKAWLGEAR